MLSDTPWEGLSLGGIDSRRVDHAGKWNFFWTIMSREDPTLAMQLHALSYPAPRVPKLRSIETGLAALVGGQTFYLRLKDHDQLELFETLCRDVIDCAELADTEAEALTHAIRRTCRWHHLLRGGRDGGLTEEEQKGLIGELVVLERLADAIGPRAAITAWTGPMGAPKDFELHGHCIEVKAHRSASQPYVQISNEFQLADVDDHQLWLSVLTVDKVVEPFGHSLDHFVEHAASCFRTGDQDIELLWETAISAAGYRVEDNYSEVRWVASEPVWHDVREDFPRINLPLRVGVNSVRYSIALSACEPFQMDAKQASEAISKGYEYGEMG